MNFVIENEKGEIQEILLSAGEAHHVKPGRKHRMIAVEDCDIFEVSTAAIIG